MLCSGNRDRPLHVALRIPSPMSIENYYAIATLIEITSLINNNDGSFLFTENRLGQTPFDLALVRYEDILRRINQHLDEFAQNNDGEDLLADAEIENPEYRLYFFTITTLALYQQNTDTDVEIALSLLAIDSMFSDLMDSVTKRGFTILNTR